MSTYTQTQPEQNSTKKTRRPFIIIALLLITAVILSQTAGFSRVTTFFKNASALSNATTLWETQQIDSYSYNLQVSCFCIPDMTRPVNIVVSDGVVQSVTYLDDETAADPDLFAYYSTIGQLFTIIEDAQSQGPAAFYVTFDQQYGVPQSVSIDIDERMADEEIMFTVSSFQPTADSE